MISKKGAIELSMTTIIVVVLSLALLIMGFVLIRNIMCGAITATNSLNKGVTGYINDLFSSSGGDVSCLGAGDPVVILAGEPHSIWCSVKSETDMEYIFQIEINEVFSTVPKTEIEKWLASDADVTKLIGASDREAKDIFKLNIPKRAQEGDIAFDITVKEKESKIVVWSGTVKYEVEQSGAMKGFLC